MDDSKAALPWETRSQAQDQWLSFHGGTRPPASRLRHWEFRTEKLRKIFPDPGPKRSRRIAFKVRATNAARHWGRQNFYYANFKGILNFYTNRETSRAVIAHLSRYTCLCDVTSVYQVKTYIQKDAINRLYRAILCLYWECNKILSSMATMPSKFLVTRYTCKNNIYFFLFVIGGSRADRWLDANGYGHGITLVERNQLWFWG